MRKILVTMLQAGMIALVSLGVCGCAILAGTDDGQGLPGGPQMRFVETLRNQESLKGEGWRENSILSSPTASSLQRPNSVYADDFKVYVTDRSMDSSVTSARVFVFDRGARTVTILDQAKGVKLLNPSGIVVDASGVIFVADAQQGRVFGYDLQGRNLYTIGKRGELQFPAGLAADRKRNKLYVADAHAHVVKVFDNIGMFLYDVGTTSGPGELKQPVAVALDRTGAVYVLDARRKRVAIYDGEGSYLRSFALTNDSPAAPLKPLGLAVDAEGRLLVTDEASSNVLIYDNKGTLLTTWGKNGRLVGDFWLPAGIFIDDRNMIYVADQMNSRVQEFQYIR
jgi:DNA-binding beta-propeller fold protein YncE